MTINSENKQLRVSSLEPGTKMTRIKNGQMIFLRVEPVLDPLSHAGLERHLLARELAKAHRV